MTKIKMKEHNDTPTFIIEPIFDNVIVKVIVKT